MSALHGKSGAAISPMVSGSPSMRFAFWSAWPDEPLVEVVEGREHHDPARAAVGDDAEVDEVRAADVARRRRLAVGQDDEEGLVGVGLREGGVDRLAVAADVDRREDAAVLRQEVGHEGHLDRAAGGLGELLVELGEVAVLGDVVGVVALGDLGVERALLRRAAGAGDAGGEVDDDVVGVDDAGLEQRQEAVDAGRGVAAGAGDEAGRRGSRRGRTRSGRRPPRPGGRGRRGGGRTTVS